MESCQATVKAEQGKHFQMGAKEQQLKSVSTERPAQSRPLKTPHSGSNNSHREPPACKGRCTSLKKHQGPGVDALSWNLSPDPSPSPHPVFKEQPILALSQKHKTGKA